MVQEKILPTVVIVGRMNVGKSTLFNRLSSSVKSMTRDYAGLTRDLICDTVHWQGRAFTLIDTGGLTFHTKADALQEKVHQKAAGALAHADVVVLVVDGAVGLVAEDRAVVRRLHELKKQFIVVINKIDAHETAAHQHEFAACGTTQIIPLSAEHGTGIGELLEVIVHWLPVAGVAGNEQRPHYSVTLLGKPNVGKSSLMNALVRYERSIVYDEPGTTREAIAEHISFNTEHLLLVDTPGLRRKSGITEDIESSMAHSSLQALTAADIILLVVDGSTGALVDQELKLGFYAFAERHKALILVVNKADIMDDEARASLASAVGPYQHLLKKIPILTISCRTDKNIHKVLPVVQQVWQRHHQELPTAAIYHLFVNALEKHPLIRNKQKLVVHEVRQLASVPITLGLSVNEPAWFGPTQRAFFENLLRAEYDLVGVPLKFIVRRKLSRGE